jgi:hypothetical protein
VRGCAALRWCDDAKARVGSRWPDGGTTIGSGVMLVPVSAPAAYRGNATCNSGEINLKFQLTPALLLAAAYAYTKGIQIRSTEKTALIISNLKKFDIINITVFKFC